ncbi:MAG: helix-turn-helix domain-containing protein [Verrucomicrobiota bacterium]
MPDARHPHVTTLTASLAFENWEPELQPARAVCELFDHVDDVLFWIKNRAGFYCWANATFLRTYEMKRRQDIVGKTDYDISPAHIAAQFRADDELVFNGECINNRIELLGRYDHTACWCVTFKQPLRNAEGQIIGAAGITRRVKPDGQDWQSFPLGKVAGYISEHFHDPLDNHQLARLAGLSGRTFERQFRRHYGVSPQQYLRRLRVRLACHALVYTGHSIGRIAVDHGFTDQSHFTREFREEIGQTPGDYRKGFGV